MAKSISYLTDGQVIQITEEFCNHNLKDITHMLRSANTFSSFMNGLCSWSDSSEYTFRIDSFDGTDIYIIQFNMRRKLSIFCNICNIYLKSI